MGLHLIEAPKGANKKKRIVGRGRAARRGGNAGRGNKGQNSRSGGHVRPGFEGGQMPLYRRIARKGFSNYPFKKNVVSVNLDILEKKYINGETVSLETLKEKKIIKKSENSIKILGMGELNKKLKVQSLSISKTAKEKIEKAGGEIVQIEENASESS